MLLPVELSSFIGREDAIAECCALLLKRRLVTLTGAGGIGKSRLALQVARCCAGAFPDGLFLVELASVEEPALVPRSVATALGLAEHAGEELTDMLVVALHAQRLLLIMDDCERQVEACASLASRLLLGARGLSVLATSRERLDIAGEAVWRVPALKTPLPDASFEAMASSESVHLFENRAKEVAPWFRLDPGNAPLAAQVCRRLDGIPLAIELAAARMKAVNLDQLLERLEGRFELMMRGSRTAPTRQQTLWATIDWSYQMLTEPERVLFRRLSVFSGGFGIEAAEIVTRGDPLGPGDTLPLIERLIDKSLLVSEARSGIVRQRMLESLRQYAQARLREQGEEDQLRRRHFNWMLKSLESIDPLRMTLQRAAERTLDLDNFRAALTWAVDAAEAELALRLAVAAGVIWSYRGQFAEGIRWLTRALEVPGAADGSSSRAYAQKWIGILSYGLGDICAARAALKRATELISGNIDSRQPPFCAEVRGDIERASGNLDDALRLLRAARDDYQKVHLTFWEQSTLFKIGSVLFEQGDYAGARESCERCLALGGDLAWATARAQIVLAYLAEQAGRHVEAEHLADEALTRLRAQGDVSGVGIGLRALSQFALEQGCLARALGCLTEALEIAVSEGDRMALARNLETLACLLAEEAPTQAAQVDGFARTVRGRTGTQPWPSEQARLRHWLGLAQTRAGDRAYEESRQLGANMSDTDAVSAARKFLTEALKSHETSAPANTLSAPLTQRQQEVAALVARGLTNEQIGEKLVVSPATARAHVEHILGRLGLHGRSQLAAWAVGHGLTSEVDGQ